MIYRGKETRTKTLKDKQIKVRKQSANKSVNQSGISSIGRLFPKLSEVLHNKEYTRSFVHNGNNYSYVLVCRLRVFCCMWVEA